MSNKQINKSQQEQENKKKKGIVLWWRNLSNVSKIAICCLAGAAVTTAIVVPTVIAINNKGINRRVDIQGAALKNATPKKVGDNLEIDLTCSNDKHEIKEVSKVAIGNVVLEPSDYTFDKVNHKLIIKKSGLDKAEANANITLELVEKEKEPEVIKVTSVSISNKPLAVGNGEEVELTATVLPENATNKELDWTITTGSSNAEIVSRDDKTYLKGTNLGDVTVKATSKDGSDKSDSKDFKVILSYLEYTQVGQTDTCLVKAKAGKTLPDNVVVPEKDPLTNRTVVGIAPYGFSGTGLNVKTITFEKSDNITTISASAFRNNNSLVSFTIPKNVEDIGNYAFQFEPSQAGTTRSLTTITIESGSKLKRIGRLAFNCQNLLQQITIPSTVEFIGQDAFCFTGLTSATFGDTTTNWLFKGSSGNEVWTPTSDASTNAAKLKPDSGYYGIIKNTITISGDSSVKTTSTITLSIPEKYSVVEWKSSDTSIATVDSSTGVVTGVAVGSCYIYVVADEGEKVGIKKIDVELLKTVNVTYDTTSFTTIGKLSIDKQSSTFTNAGSLNFDIVSTEDDNKLQFHIIIKKQGGDTIYTSSYLVIEPSKTKSIKIDSKDINWTNLNNNDNVVVSIEWVLSVSYNLSQAPGITLVSSPNTLKKGETLSFEIKNTNAVTKNIYIRCTADMSGCTIVAAIAGVTIDAGATKTTQLASSGFNWSTNLFINPDNPNVVDSLTWRIETY